VFKKTLIDFFSYFSAIVTGDFRKKLIDAFPSNVVLGHQLKQRNIIKTLNRE
jgi:hypothetical protein